MTNPTSKNPPPTQLAEGEHAGFRWRVLHNSMGYRCGYILIPHGHPWHGKSYDDIPAEVHGGLTYGDEEGWVGFDCAHAGDAPDPALPGAYKMRPFDGGEIRTQEYAEAECRSLCEQAAAPKPVPLTPEELLAEVERLKAQQERLREALRDLIDSYDEEGGFILSKPDAGCPDCTGGLTPDNANTGPCPFHAAKRALAEVGEPQP